MDHALSAIKKRVGEKPLGCVHLLSTIKHLTAAAVMYFVSLTHSTQIFGLYSVNCKRQTHKQKRVSADHSLSLICPRSQSVSESAKESVGRLVI